MSEASDPISKTMHFLPAYLASSLSVISLKHLVRWEKRWGRGTASPKIYIYYNSLIFRLICMKFGRGVNYGNVDTHVYFEDSTTLILAMWPKMYF